MRSATLAMIERLMNREVFGAMDFRRHPEKGVAWGGPFNGQVGRRAIFQAIIQTLHPSVIFETGTYLGTTTEYMAETGLPVITVEGGARNFGFARARLSSRPNVSLNRGDSRTELRRLLANPPAGLPFFYLDAHWNADLPLAEELEIIYAVYPSAIVMIDDFQAPGDPDYAYDDYGPGKALIPDYIEPAIQKFGLTAYYPALRGAEETGAKRGCVVLMGGDVAGAGDSIALLRRAEG